MVYTFVCLIDRSGSMGHLLITKPSAASGDVVMNNGTPCPTPDPAGGDGPPINYSPGESAAIVFVLSLIVLLTIFGNSVVICSVAMFRQMRTLTNYFILSLAVADIFVALLVMPFGIYNLHMNLRWELGSVVCRLASCLDVMMTSTSILHLSCLAMDRYIAICCPFFYHQIMTRRTVFVLIFCCWTIPVFISWFPIFNGWHEIGIEDVIKCHTPPDGRACMFLVNIPFALICSLIIFYIPTLFMLMVNVRIYQEATRQAMRIRSLEMTTLGEQKREKTMRHERKAAKTLSIIMGTYSMCWFPFFIFNVVDPMVGYRIPFTAWQLALWLGYVNSTMNPFLYYFFNRTFRQAFTRILLCHKCRGIVHNDNNFLTGVSSLSD